MKNALVKQNKVAKVTRVQVEVIEEQDWGNPMGDNCRPARNMGVGTHQIFLQNDPMTAAHVVQQIIQQVFKKDAMEAQFVMQEAHYKGFAHCFNASLNQAEEYLAQIEQMKMKAVLGGCPRKHIENLTFTIQSFQITGR